MPVPPWRSRRCSSASQASYSGPPGRTTRCPNGPFADYRENGNGVFMSLRLAAAVHPDMRRIRDRVPGATVGLRNTGTNQSRTFTTGRDGLYAFFAVAPGEYEISAAAPGIGGKEGFEKGEGGGGCAVSFQANQCSPVAE